MFSLPTLGVGCEAEAAQWNEQRKGNAGKKDDEKGSGREARRTAQKREPAFPSDGLSGRRFSAGNTETGPPKWICTDALDSEVSRGLTDPATHRVTHTTVGVAQLGGGAERWPGRRRGRGRYPKQFSFPLEGCHHSFSPAIRP